MIIKCTLYLYRICQNHANTSDSDTRNDWNLRIYQNHANMSDTPLGSPAGWEGARNSIFLGTSS